MRKETVYFSNDNQMFHNKEDCEIHEFFIKFNEKIGIRIHEDNFKKILKFYDITEKISQVNQ